MEQPIKLLLDLHKFEHDKEVMRVQKNYAKVRKSKAVFKTDGSRPNLERGLIF